MNLAFKNESFSDPLRSAISPYRELGAYEALWLEKGATFKRIAERFAASPHALPSDFIDEDIALGTAQETFQTLGELGVEKFGVRVHRAGDYPRRLRDAKYPVELLYYQGAWEFSEAPGIAIVGSRKASDDGLQRAAKLAGLLADEGYTVVSGLAAGIDTAAHTGALRVNGRTIAVIGTPIGHYYPKQNESLQREIAESSLVISQVPLLRYMAQDYRSNRAFFPERNVTMSALTEATVIVEASNTSGTLTQAKAALFQGRKLFILESCFHRSDIDWPERFERLGAIRVKDLDDILKSLR
jgi:DNA processing protein